MERTAAAKAYILALGHHRRSSVEFEVVEGAAHGLDLESASCPLVQCGMMGLRNHASVHITDRGGVRSLAVAAASLALLPMLAQ